jgi:phosphatidate cytidylyltransferase
VSIARDRPLLARVLSAALLAALALPGIVAGGWPYALMLSFAMAVLGWEWTRLCAAGRFSAAGILVIAAPLATLLGFRLGGDALAGFVVLASPIVVYLGSRVLRHVAPSWLAAGSLYLAIPSYALIALRDAPDGARIVLFLILVVAASDTAAYFVGRIVGGPKLAPRISPNKTWSGFGGAVIGAIALAILFVLLDPIAQRPNLFVIAAIAGALAVIGQAGDLAESAVKRHFGVKDASDLIPGHGGLLDRVDALVAAAVVLALFQAATGGRFLTWAGS